MTEKEYVLNELQDLQKRTGEAINRLLNDAGMDGERLVAETVRNDETDAALVEVGGIAADNAATGEELMEAQVEIAGLVDTALARADEQDAALVELAGLIAGGTTGEGGVA